MVSIYYSIKILYLYTSIHIPQKTKRALSWGMILPSYSINEIGSVQGRTNDLPTDHPDSRLPRLPRRLLNKCR